MVWLVLCLGVIIVIVALGTDGGRMLEERRRVQSAADAAGWDQSQASSRAGEESPDGWRVVRTRCGIVVIGVREHHWKQNHGGDREPVRR